MTEPVYSTAGRDALEAARAEAARLGHDRLGTEHLLLGLLRQAHPAVLAVLTERGLSADVVRTRLEEGAKPGTAEPGDPPVLRPRAERALAAAAAAAGGEPVRPEHLLAAIAAERGGPAARALGVAPGERPAAPAPGDAAAEPSVSPDDQAPPAPPARPPREPKPPKPPRPPRQEKPVPKPPPRADRKPDQRVRDEVEPRESRRELEIRARRAEVEESLRAAAQARSPAPVPRPPRAARNWFGLLVRGLLLACVPLSWYLAWAHAAPGLVFAIACLGVLPLAGWMGEATEHLAARTGPTVGGLLNATFGNAAELIIAVAALRQGLVDLVKASITGSILGNLLLILGLSFVAAGTKTQTFRFNRTAAGMSAGMLALAVIGLVFPALFHSLHPEAGRVEELHLSEIVAVVLLLTYLASLLFSLKTHSRVFGGDPHPTTGKVWTVPRAVGLLVLATAATAVQAEILVHATEAVTAGSGLSEIFLGLIIIPLIGNAAEHATAVVVARKGQTDLALQIALGSSTQVALLIAPLLVFIGLFLGQGMNLAFTPFEVIALAMSTAVAAIITLDGESHWFEGVQLLAVYALVAAGALFI
jgi:Ca2+:H+ antiporter